MNIAEAKHAVVKYRIAGAALMFISVLFSVCAGLKTVYFATANDVSPLVGLARQLRLAVYFIYEKTQAASYIWEWAPVIDPFHLNTAANFVFLLIVIVGTIGRLIWDSAAHLARRIRDAEQAAEAHGWQRQLGAGPSHATAAPDRININIELDQKDQWYKRPLGIVLLALAGGVLLQWLNLKLGLAKL
jgi:hypothetical protein